jgi:hypothetical protein
MLALDADAYYEVAEVSGSSLRRLFLQSGLPASDAEDLATSCMTDIALKVHRSQTAFYFGP